MTERMIIINSFIPWIGGKKLLRKKIIEMFPVDYDRYIEVFGGAGWVLFGKEKHADFEVYNDVQGELVNLYRCIKYHAEEVQKELEHIINAREFFEDFKQHLSSRGHTDIQRAARYFFLIKTSYGGNQRSFGCSKRNLISSTDYLTEIKRRLSTVIIENKDFENLIKVYDRPNALFYLDPPYHGTEKYYDTGFDEDAHYRLRKCLGKIKGKFILSYNNDKFIKDLYIEFNIQEIERSNNLAQRYDENKQYKELIITNY